MAVKYFTKQQSLEKIGKIIGASGTVVRADGEGDQWTVAIQWHLPTKESWLTGLPNPNTKNS